MNFLKIALAAAFAGSFAGISAAHATNILVNPGFESGSIGTSLNAGTCTDVPAKPATGDQPWFQARNCNGSQNWTITTSVFHGGSASATATGNKELRQNFSVATPVDTIDAITFFAMHPAGGDTGIGQVDMFVDLFFSDGTDHGDNFPTFTSGFEFIDATSLLSAAESLGKSLVGFSIFGDLRSATFIDDVTIDVSTVPEPTTLAVLGAGLLGLGLVRRRRGVA